MISMTGFAARRGAGLGYGWAWDLRSVNGKGFDLRLRVPDWIDGLELAIRADLQRAVVRGNVSLTRIDTRPSRTEKWAYVVFIEFEGHLQDEKIAAIMAELEEQSIMLKPLGSYPQALL